MNTLKLVIKYLFTQDYTCTHLCLQCSVFDTVDWTSEMASDLKENPTAVIPKGTLGDQSKQINVVENTCRLVKQKTVTALKVYKCTVSRD